MPSPTHKGIQNVQFKMIIRFTALLKFAGVHVGHCFFSDMSAKLQNLTAFACATATG